jgi:transposase
VGKRPVARFKRGYKWTYLYGFVKPESGEVFWLILPTVNVQLFSMALKEFAKEVGAGENKRVLLVVDQAGWHTGGEVDLPEGIHLEFLPSGSPELMPAERLWPLTNEAVANRLFEKIEELEEALVERWAKRFRRSVPRTPEVTTTSMLAIAYKPNYYETCCELPFRVLLREHRALSNPLPPAWFCRRV